MQIRQTQLPLEHPLCSHSFFPEGITLDYLAVVVSVVVLSWQLHWMVGSQRKPRWCLPFIYFALFLPLNAWQELLRKKPAPFLSRRWLTHSSGPERKSTGQLAEGRRCQTQPTRLSEEPGSAPVPGQCHKRRAENGGDLQRERGRAPLGPSEVPGLQAILLLWRVWDPVLFL